MEVHEQLCIWLFLCIFEGDPHLIRHHLHQLLVAHGPQLRLGEDGAVQGLVDGGQPAQATLLGRDLSKTKVYDSVHCVIQLHVQPIC